MADDLLCVGGRRLDAPTVGAEQLPSINGTFERSMPGSALLPRPSVSSSRLHGGIHEQSWSPGGVALGRDLHGSDQLIHLQRTLFLLIILIYARLRNAQRTWFRSSMLLLSTLSLTITVPIILWLTHHWLV